MSTTALKYHLFEEDREFYTRLFKAARELTGMRKPAIGDAIVMDGFRFEAVACNDMSRGPGVRLMLTAGPEGNFRHLDIIAGFWPEES